MEKTEIKKVTLNDISILHQVSRQTFVESFAAGNSEANMVKYLEQNFSEQKLTDELKNEESRFYFVLIDGEVVGYLKLNFGRAQTEPQGDKGLEIERIYVLRPYHGKNIGQLLYNKAMEVAYERGFAFVWLGVWEKNPRAIRFYQKNGFTEFDKHLFKLGEDEQTDLLMKKILHT